MIHDITGKKPACGIIPRYMEKKVANNSLDTRKAQDVANQQLENSQDFRNQRSKISLDHKITRAPSGKPCADVIPDS